MRLFTSPSLRRPRIVAPILMLVVVMVDGFGRPRNHRNKQSWKTMKHCNSCRDVFAAAPAAMEKSTSDEISRKSTNVDYDPHYKCHLVEFGVVQKIPYESSDPDGGYNLLDVDFSSACLRCGICLAVAQKINESLMEVHLHNRQQWLENDQVVLVLEAVCDDQQFRGYALREIEGKRYIGDGSLPGATLVATSADGRWESNLKSKCDDIVKRAGSRELYKHWREWCENSSSDLLVDFVCRSNETAGLGDCRSIKGDASRPDYCQPDAFYRADIKLTATLGSNFF